MGGGVSRYTLDTPKVHNGCIDGNTGVDARYTLCTIIPSQCSVLQ